jgi:predicted nuclease of predicted toxin-antitoxin system
VRLAKLGLDADTVVDEGLRGSTDADVLAAARAEERMVFTLDRGFGNIKTYPPAA